MTKLSRKKDLLSGMPAGIWALLLEQSQPVQLEPGEPLFHADDPGEGCYVVQSGALKATIMNKDGRQRMLAVFSSGMIVGEMALFDDEPRSATVTAIRKSKLNYIPRDTFFHIADGNTEAYRYALRVMALRLRNTNSDAMAQGNAPVASKVARAMLALTESLGDGNSNMIAQRVTQFDIGTMAGVARENVNRCLNAWKREGIIEKKGYYRLLNRPALVRIMNG